MREIDEIMAEYLLKGGKMLAKTCSICHAPLFEYKGERFCVVCAGAPSTEDGSVPGATEIPSSDDDSHQETKRSPSTLEESITDAIGMICRRMADEPDPARCAIYMQIIKEGALALEILSRR